MLVTFMGVFCLFAANAHAQHTVSGRVISSDDQQPLIGVQVAIKGTNIGVATDLDGMFSINVQSTGATLVFSYLGYKSQEATVGSRTAINIVLEPDAQMMDEVIVMGYTSIKKSELTSSLVSLSGEKLTDVTTPDLGTMLQGKASGVMVTNSSGQPGSSATIRIRGTGSITADSGPLYVVDGIPGGTFDPMDVETITVLKDIGATAIYGANGAGGVIVVTTKSASKNQPVRVNFRANGGVKNALLGRFKVMDSKELLEAHRYMWNPDRVDEDRPMSLLERDFDWVDATFKPGAVQNYYASVSGGSENISYMASFNHYNEKGTLINTNFKRNNVRLNLNAKLGKNLDMSIRANYRESDNKQTSSWVTLETGYRAMPWDNPYDKDGNPIYVDSENEAGRNWYGINKWNIFHNELYNYNTTSSRRLSTDFQLNWRILPWLTATSTTRFNRGETLRMTYIDPRTISPTYKKDGYLSNSIGLSKGYGSTNLLKAVHQSGDHSINAMVGFEFGYWHDNSLSGSGKNMPVGMDVLDATASSTHSVGGSRTPGGSWSAFGQLQYSYADRYILSGTFRADADGNFAPNNKVGYFPSVSAGWIVSNEGFLRDNKVLTFLKLRGSFGYTGNSRIGNFEYLDTFSFNTDYNGQLAATPDRMPNPNLKWETARMISAGIDFNLYHWLEVNLDIYDTRNKDLLLDVPVEPSTGFFKFLANVGEVQNRGFELQLTSTNFNRKDFNWTTSFNIGINRNKVLSLPDGIPMIRGTASRQIIEEGRDMFTWYMPEWLGVNPDNGEPMWWGDILNEDGEKIGEGPTSIYKNATDRYLGTASPKFTGGLINTFRYKSWSLNIVASFVYGNKIYHASRASMDADGAYLDYNMMSLDNGLGWNRWEKPGDNATHPKLVMNGNMDANSMSSRYLEDGSHLRIKNVTLAYALPKSFLSKIHVSGCSVFVSADNLLTWSKFSGADPEVNLSVSGTSSVAGNYSMNYPVGRLFSVGLDIRF